MTTNNTDPNKSPVTGNNGRLLMLCHCDPPEWHVECPDGVNREVDVSELVASLQTTSGVNDDELDEIFDKWRGSMLTRGLNAPSGAVAVDEEAKQTIRAKYIGRQGMLNKINALDVWPNDDSEYRGSYKQGYQAALNDLRRELGLGGDA